VHQEFNIVNETLPTDKNPIIIPEDIYIELCYELRVDEITLMGVA